MLHVGAILTAAATLGAAIGYVWAATRAERDADKRGASHAVTWLYTIIGSFLVIAASRQIAGILSGFDARFVTADRILFYMVVVPAAFSSLPLLHLTGRLLAWPAERIRALLWVFASAAVVGLSQVYMQGITGPDVSPWGTEWAINSIIAGVLVLLILTLPALAFSILVLRAGWRLEAPHRRRVTLMGASCLIFYIVFTVDAFAAPGPMLLAERLATLLASGLAVSAYRGTTRRPVMVAQAWGR